MREQEHSAMTIEQPILRNGSRLREKLLAKRAAERLTTDGAPQSPSIDSAQIVFSESNKEKTNNSIPANNVQASREFVPSELPPGLVRAGFISLGDVVDSATYTQLMADKRTEKFRVEIDGVIYIKKNDIQKAVDTLQLPEVPIKHVIFEDLNKMKQKSKEKKRSRPVKEKKPTKLLWRLDPELEEQGYVLATTVFSKAELSAFRANKKFSNLLLKTEGRLVVTCESVEQFRQYREEKTLRKEARRIKKHAWVINEALKEQGFVPYGQILTEAEQTLIRISKRYAHLIVRDNKHIVMRQQDAEEFRRLRTIPRKKEKTMPPRNEVKVKFTRLQKRSTPPADKQQMPRLRSDPHLTGRNEEALQVNGFVRLNRILNEQETRAIRTDEAYNFLVIKENGVLYMREQDAHAYRTDRASLKGKRSIPYELQEQGYRQISEFLTRSELMTLLRLGYNDLVQKVNGTYLITEAGVNEFHARRAKAKELQTRKSEIKVRKVPETSVTNPIPLPSPILAEEGYLHISQFLTPQERAHILQTKCLSHLLKKENGKYFMREIDVAEYNRYRHRSNQNRLTRQNKKETKEDAAWKMNREYEIAGYRPCLEFLTRTERNALIASDAYADLVVNDNGRWIMREPDVEEFKKRRAIKLAKPSERIPQELKEQGYIPYSRLLTPQEQAIIRQSKGYEDLLRKENGLLIMRPQDAEEFKKRRAERKNIHKRR
jgi:hypothetical protein